MIANEGCIINNTRNIQEFININTRIRQIYSDQRLEGGQNFSILCYPHWNVVFRVVKTLTVCVRCDLRHLGMEFGKITMNSQKIYFITTYFYNITAKKKPFNKKVQFQLPVNFSFELTKFTGFERSQGIEV